MPFYAVSRLVALAETTEFKERAFLLAIRNPGRGIGPVHAGLLAGLLLDIRGCSLWDEAAKVCRLYGNGLWGKKKGCEES
jgi:hypothetical protein